MQLQVLKSWCPCVPLLGLWLWQFLITKLVDAAFVQVDSPAIALKGQSAILKFHVVTERTDTTDLKMMSIRCGVNADSYDSSTMLLDGNDAAFNLYSQNIDSSRYAGRLKPSNVVNQDKFITTYVVTLLNCSYADEAVFGCTYQFRLSETTLSMSRTTFTVLQIEGPPENCPRSLPAKIDPQLGDRPNFIVDICGNPKPTITVVFAGMPLLDFTFKNATDKVKYRYHCSIQLPELSKEMCGESLAYTAVNRRGQLLDEMVVELKPKPGLVTKIEGTIVYDKSSNETCIKFLRWKSADIGRCPSTYIIRVYSEDFSETIETNVTYLENRCFSGIKTSNITGVQVQAYLPVSKEIGPASGAAVLHYYIQEVRPTVPSHTPSGLGIPGGDDNTIVIIAAAVAGVVLILVLVGVACCVRRRRKGYLDEILADSSGPPVYSAVYVEPEYEDVASLASPKETSKPNVEPAPVVYESARDRPRETLLYADLGPTGAHPEEHRPPKVSLYSEVKTDGRGFPVVGDVLEEDTSETDTLTRHQLPVQSKHLRKGDKKPGDFDIELEPFTLKADNELNQSDEGD